MSLQAMSDQDILDDIRSFEEAIRMYRAELERRFQEAEHALRLSEDNSQTPAEVSIAGPTTTATTSAGHDQQRRRQG